jgi:hypothetical protein
MKRCIIKRWCIALDCEVKLKSLANEYRSALEEQIVKGFCDIEKGKEFDSDEWWMSRGL